MSDDEHFAAAIVRHLRLPEDPDCPVGFPFGPRHDLHKTMPQTVIFDIDGTIADVSHRLPHLDKDPPDWKAFNRDIGDDTVHEPILRLLTTLKRTNCIVLCSGRDAGFKRHTELWLTYNLVPYDALYMRPAGDRRKDHIVKMELLDQIIADGFQPWLVVDDRGSVVKAWRARGLTCLQCAPGDF